MAIDFPDAYERLQPEVVPFAFIPFNASKGGLRAEPGFYLIQLLSLCLLVVACANVGMLIFARTAARSSELAVRTALGASRARIVSQVFTESLVLAVSAGGVGLLILHWLPARMLSVVTSELPYWIDTGVRRGTILQALSLAAFSAAVAGVVPALIVTGKAVHRNIQRSQADRSGIRFGRMSGALIVADIAIAVVVVGLTVGLADRSWWAAEANTGVGIPAEEYLSVRLRLPRGEVVSESDPSIPSEFTTRLAETQRALVQQLRAEPEILGVAMGSSLPRMQHHAARVELEGAATAADFRGHRVRTARVDVDFFSALETPILSGRGFTTNDLGADASTVIVNTTFVDNVLGGRNAIGRRVRYWRSPPQEAGPWYEIVGVVGQLGMKTVDPTAVIEAPAVLNAVNEGDRYPFSPRCAAQQHRLGRGQTRAGPDCIGGGDWHPGGMEVLRSLAGRRVRGIGGADGARSRSFGHDPHRTPGVHRANPPCPSDHADRGPAGGGVDLGELPSVQRAPLERPSPDQLTYLRLRRRCRPHANSFGRLDFPPHISKGDHTIRSGRVNYACEFAH
jgi:FtsX-like permease family/MacB-like periplasmic core domain